MSFKSKALGVVAAAVLGVSVASGSALASFGPGTTALLNGDPLACSAALVGGSANFGTYNYNLAYGTYTLQGAAPTIQGKIQPPNPGQKCLLNVSGNDLTGTYYTGQTISAAKISVKGTDAGTTGGTLATNANYGATGKILDQATAGGTVTAEIDVDITALNALPPDTYTGYIIVSGGFAQ